MAVVDEEFLQRILDTKDDVLGEIYVVTNKTTGKQYVGQTVTHRLNHGKYRPFGTPARFKHHLSESKYNKTTKRKGYLQTAIDEEGPEAFEVERLLVCPIDEMDKFEKHYIDALNTTYPNGYNLTDGGKKGATPVANDFKAPTEIVRAGNAWRHKPRSDGTRELMSKNLKKAHENPEVKKTFASKARDQHMQARLSLFKPVAHTIPKGADLSSFIKLRRRKTDNSVVFAHVTIADKTTRFHSTETSPDVEAQALEFLKMLVIDNDQVVASSSYPANNGTQVNLRHDQIAGNP